MDSEVLLLTGLRVTRKKNENNLIDIKHVILSIRISSVVSLRDRS